MGDEPATEATGWKVEDGVLVRDASLVAETEHEALEDEPATEATGWKVEDGVLVRDASLVATPVTESKGPMPKAAVGCLGILALSFLIALIVEKDKTAGPSGNGGNSDSVFSTGQSSTCGQVTGETAKDRDNALAFCAKGILKGTVVGVTADSSAVWIEVPRDMADALRADRLSAEHLVNGWMAGWKIESGLPVVTVHVEWKEVEIATGQSTLLSGDQVTIR